jgi:hypothetical protein
MKFVYWMPVLIMLTIMLIFTVTGCNGKTTTPATTQANPTGEIVFSDSFSGTNTNWLTYSEDYGYVNLQDGALHILNYTNSDYSCDTYPYLSFTDFILEVDMTFIEGSTNNWQSVMARYSGDSLYYFDISADGYYSIGIWDDTAYEYDSLVETTYSEYILQGRNTNTVRVECIGNSLSLTVNGHILAQVTDSTCTTGEVGLEVSSMDGDYSKVSFDNFVIYTP